MITIIKTTARGIEIIRIVFNVLLLAFPNLFVKEVNKYIGIYSILYSNNI